MCRGAVTLAGHDVDCARSAPWQVLDDMMSAAAVEAQSSGWVGGAMGGGMGGAYFGAHVPAPVLAYQGFGDGFGGGSADHGSSFGNGAAPHLVSPGLLSPQSLGMSGHPLGSPLGGHSPHELGSPGGGGEGGMQ